MKISEKLMNLRKTKGISQEELADKLNVTRQTISKWELDQTVPDMNKLIEISKFFEISLDELINDVETATSENTYKESATEKNNKKISIRIFIVGLIITLILCCIGFGKQLNAKKTNEERAKQAYERSQNAVEQAEKRWEEINTEIKELSEAYEKKSQEMDSMNMRDPNWFENHSKAQRELSNINADLNALTSEKFQLENTDYTGYYSLVEPLTYLIFYYIGAGVFALMSLIALIFFLVTRKK